MTLSAAPLPPAIAVLAGRTISYTLLIDLSALPIALAPRDVQCRRQERDSSHSPGGRAHASSRASLESRLERREFGSFRLVHVPVTDLSGEILQWLCGGLYRRWGSVVVLFSLAQMIKNKYLIDVMILSHVEKKVFFGISIKT